MKRENGIYLLAFLCGIIIVNLPGNAAWANNSILNRYSLASFSFQGIVYEEYLLEILFLRFQTVVALWMCSKLISKNLVRIGYALIICGILGGIMAIAILANGLWGIWFFICALLPHTICYFVAYMLWGKALTGYVGESKRRIDYFTIAIIIMLVGIGCILEAYISPVLIENLIKY